MDTLDVKFDEHAFRHKYASLRWKLGWKLRMSKWPWGAVYRYFWRKRLIKRINEVSRIIAEKSVRGKEDFIYQFPAAINNPNYDLTVPAGLVPIMPLAPPAPGIPPILTVPPINPSLHIVPDGVAVMDPTRLYSMCVLPCQMDSSNKPRKRVYHLRKKQPAKRIRPLKFRANPG